MNSEFFHGNNTLYENGEKIIKHYNLNTKIVDVYKEKLKGHDPRSLVYMHDHVKEEYLDCYKYMYSVVPVNPIKCRMDFSPYLLACDLHIFEKQISAKNMSLDELINLFADAYVFNLDEKKLQQLCSAIGYTDTNINATEFISSQVVVKDVIAVDGELLNK